MRAPRVAPEEADRLLPPWLAFCLRLLAIVWPITAFFWAADLLPMGSDGCAPVLAWLAQFAVAIGGTVVLVVLVNTRSRRRQRLLAGLVLILALAWIWLVAFGPGGTACFGR